MNSDIVFCRAAAEDGRWDMSLELKNLFQLSRIHNLLHLDLSFEESVTPLDFDGSFNPISSRRGKLCPPHYLQPRIFKSYYFNSFAFVSTLTLTDLLNRLDDLDPKKFYGFFSLPSLIFKKPDDSTSSQAQTQRRVLGRGGEARGKGPI